MCWRNVLALGSHAEHLHLQSPLTESAAEVREREALSALLVLETLDVQFQSQLL